MHITYQAWTDNAISRAERRLQINNDKSHYLFFLAVWNFFTPDAVDISRAWGTVRENIEFQTEKMK
jgi:hypothetical protein